MSDTGEYILFRLGKYKETVEESLMSLKENNVISRIWAHDYTVWKPDPREITDRLGWLKIMDTMREEVETISEFVDSVRREG